MFDKSKDENSIQLKTSSSNQSIVEKKKFPDKKSVETIKPSHDLPSVSKLTALSLPLSEQVIKVFQPDDGSNTFDIITEKVIFFRGF